MGQSFRAKSINIGSLNVKNPIVRIPSKSDGIFASPDTDGNIGGEILRRFRVIFIYAHKQVILEPTEAVGDLFDVDMSGLCLVAEGSSLRQFRVLQVLDSSPAFEARMLPNDMIVSVEGRPAKEFTLACIRERLSVEQPVRLTIQREDHTWEVILKLQRLI